MPIIFRLPPSRLLSCCQAPLWSAGGGGPEVVRIMPVNSAPWAGTYVGSLTPPAAWAPVAGAAELPPGALGTAAVQALSRLGTATSPATAAERLRNDRRSSTLVSPFSDYPDQPLMAPVKTPFVK